MTIDELKKKKQERGYSNAQISQLSGLPLGTVQKIFSGETKRPRSDTISALVRVLGTDRQNDTAALYHADIPAPSLLQEGAAAYQGVRKRYTVEDFYNMPEDWKGELIDGVLYAMSTPRFLHQKLAYLIGRQLDQFVRDHGSPCIVLPLPLDTRLDRDNYTMVEPDITVLCDRKKLVNGIIEGAPDLVIEILSPSTRLKDILIKMPKYLNAGVREYWTVDPKAGVISVYIKESEIIPKQYTFHDKVPVGIWEGKCLVDFPSILSECEDFASSPL